VIVVLQRVSSASVEVEGKVIAETGTGFLALVGVRKGDAEEDAAVLARKIAGLRIFSDDEGRFDRHILHPEVRGEVLAVSQFTLLADCRKGRRPGFDAADRPDRASALFDMFCAGLVQEGVRVRTGRFGARMSVALLNEGPVTIILDSNDLKPRPPSQKS